MKIFYLLLPVLFTQLIFSQDLKCAKSYKIKKGDTFSQIINAIKKSNKNSDEILKCNPDISNIDLIYTGNLIRYNSKLDAEPDTYKEKAITPLLVKTVSTNESKHLFKASLASLSFDMDGEQISGSGAGSKASDIISELRLAAYFDYYYKLSKRFYLWGQLGLQWSEFSSNLSNRIPKDDIDIIPSFSIGGVFKHSPRLSFLIRAHHLPQLYYSGDSTTNNIFFDTEDAIWGELGVNWTMIQKSKWDLVIGGSYMNSIMTGDLIDNNHGFQFKLISNITQGKNWQLFFNYFKGEYDFITSKVDFNRFEFGVSKKF